jgi:hypothetical protein
MKRLLAVPSVVLALVVALPGTANADVVSEAAAALRSAPVYQAAGLDLVDVATLTADLAGRDPRLDVAVLPASAASSSSEARALAVQIGRAVNDTNAVVLVITANKHLGVAEGSGAARRGVNANAALQAELPTASALPFTKDNVTAFVLSFEQRIAQQVSAASSGGSVPAPATSSGSSHTGAYLLGGLVLIGGGATLLAVRSSRTRRKRLNEGLRADVEQLYNRLGSDVATLDPGDNVVARQALADAAERFNATGATLATADAPPEFAAARRTAVEGLTAARTARTELGLDPGPEVPTLPGSGPQLEGDHRVQRGDQEYEGSPNYRPGRGHYYEGGYVGGQQVPGGWYSAPFWTPFLLGSVLSGGFGGGGIFGGGDHGGFERGYEAGQDDARPEGPDSSGGGDWGGGGGGGGDWGGGDSGGGGDW